MKTKTAYEIIEQTFKENGFGRKIKNLDYPFLRRLSKAPMVLSDELRILNVLANSVYSPGESLQPIDKLMEWHQLSPGSWLVCEIDGEIVGNIHVEPLTRKKGDALRDGLSHEGEIGYADIPHEKLLREGDYIHIGSIVSKYVNVQPPNLKVATCLLAGLADRVMQLWQIQPDRAHHIIAVDYKCEVDNKYHARKLFKMFGFEHKEDWVTSEGDPVYILDLNSNPNPSLRALESAVLARMEVYRLERRRQRSKIIRYTGGAVILITLTLTYSRDLIPVGVVSLLTGLGEYINLSAGANRLFNRFFKQ